MSLIKILKLFIYKIINKIDNNIILFCSFYGKYSDSPKYISEYIHNNDKSKKIYWLLNDLNNKEVPKYVNKIKIGTDDELKIYTKAGTIIDNTFGFRETYLTSNNIIKKLIFKLATLVKSKSKQKVYTTWHGTPIKKMSIDIKENKTIDFSCPNTTMFLDNEYEYNILKRLTFNKIDIKLLGSPKKDVLFLNNDLKSLKKKLGLNTKYKYVLFAPTFRENNYSSNVKRSGIDQLEMIDFDKLFKCLNDKFGGEWAFICRFHYHVEKEVDWDRLNSKYNGKIVNGNEYEDIMDYLLCSDILLTDISSCLFDYALTNKPMFIFFPDLDYYKNKERGLYLDMDSLPCSYSTDFKTLLKIIKSYNEKEYFKSKEEFIKKTKFIDNKNATEVVSKYILENIKEK